MVTMSDRQSWTRAQLEAAQDQFVVALRRLREHEMFHSRRHSPLDLEQAHELWSLRQTFVSAREELRWAEAAAEAAKAA